MIYAEGQLMKALHSAGYEDAHGDFHQEKAVWGEPISCDIKPLGKASTTNLGDGKVSHYEYEIFLSCDCPNFVEGETICIIQQDERKVAQVAGFVRRKYYSKLWV